MAVRHATRFIIEVRFKDLTTWKAIDCGYDKWDRSANMQFKGFYATREQATDAIAKATRLSEALKYRVRQK
jgi:hypothetical protein